MTSGPIRFSPGEAPARDPHALAGSEAHLWSIDLEADLVEVAALGDVLSAPERQRAAAFRFDRDRRRFTVSHGAVRNLLSLYCQIPPTQLTFEFGSHGKPSLVGHPDLHFNLSHSFDRAVFAVSRGGPLGVDIELVRELADATGLAERCFSAREVECYRSVATESRTEAFFNCWTGKEAVVKALGEGLSLPLDRLDISFGPYDTPRVVSIDGSPEKAAEWCLLALDLGDEFAGALAAPWTPHPVKAWRWNRAVPSWNPGGLAP